MTRQLIVNADDFGMAESINLAVAHAHDHGVVTSASLMVLRPAAAAAGVLARERPDLSVGLHAEVGEEDPEHLRDELRRQLDAVNDLTGRPATHLDAHHNRHRDPRLAPAFRDVALAVGVPLREHGPVHYLPDFYGQWDGESHPGWLTADNLVRLVTERAGPATTELAVHPGHADPALPSSYRHEREFELEALCAAGLSARLAEAGFRLQPYPMRAAGSEP